MIFCLFTLCMITLLTGHQPTAGQITLSGDPSNIPPNPNKKDTATGGTISMGTPDLSDEDSMSIHMPKYLSCDACRIISMRFSDTFAKEIAKFPSVKNYKKELSEDRIDDILENICNDEWSQYGIKQVDGINRLSGPGFETNDVPGVMQGGGKWPFRFKQFCNIIIGDLGEDVIYRTFRTSSATGLEELMCYSPIERSKSFCTKKDESKSKPTKSGRKSKANSNQQSKKPQSTHNEL